MCRSNLTSESGEMAGQISGEQAAKGITLPIDDLLIAVAAMEQGYAIATLNLRHFQKIPRSANRPSLERPQTRVTCVGTLAIEIIQTDGLSPWALWETG